MERIRGPDALREGCAEALLALADRFPKKAVELVPVFRLLLAKGPGEGRQPLSQVSRRVILVALEELGV